MQSFIFRTSGGPLAVRFGRPVYYWRSLRLSVVGMTMILMSGAAIIPLWFYGVDGMKVPGADVPLPAMFVGFQGLWFVMNIAGLFLMLSACRRLRKYPDMCLNCGYRLEPGDRSCHECGRVQNREDLSPRWAALLAVSK